MAGRLHHLIHRVRRSAAARLGHCAERASSRSIALELKNLGLDGRIPTYTHQVELEILYRLARVCPPAAHIVEIGSYLGASTCYLAAGARTQGGRITCIDTWHNETMPDGQRDTFTEFQRNLAPVSAMIATVRQASADLVSADLPRPVHLAFIDADHSYEAARADAALLLPLMAPEGVVVFHDTATFAGVSRALGEILVRGEWRIAGHVDCTTWIQRADWSPWPLPKK